MSNLVQEVQEENKRLRVYYDDSPESPRDWDNLGIMYCKWNRYTLGDVRIDSMEDVYLDLANRLNIEVEYKRDGDLTKKTINRVNALCYIYPLYCIKHSGISISMSSFADPWDSGCCGVIAIIKSQLKKECGTTSEERAKEILEGEVDLYSKYLNGEVYWYVCETVSKCECCGQEVVETVDSCCGFYDLEDIKDNVPDEFKSLAEQL